jgi:ubiquinone/menaquinone biosynthesis C-methylase UbiE
MAKAKLAKKPQQKKEVAPTPGLMLDLGCGNEKMKRPGFIGVDKEKKPGVDQVVDLTKKWPWKDESVEEVFCGHVLEYLAVFDRAHFFNELERVLKPGGRATVITHHWSSGTAYADPRVQWPPVSEQFYKNLDPKFREEIDSGLDKYFKTTKLTLSQSYRLVDWLATRNDEFKNFAISAYKEVCMDLIASINKKT